MTSYPNGQPPRSVVKASASTGLDPANYGTVDPTGVADSSAAFAAAIAALPHGGGTIRPGPGVYDLTTLGMNLNTSIGVVLDGGGAATGGAAPCVQLVYKGTGARFIDARAATGFMLKGIMVIATNPAFAGKVVDLSGHATLCAIGDGAVVQGPPTAGCIVVDLDSSQECNVSGKANIIGGQYGIRGQANVGTYSNANTIGHGARIGGQRAVSGGGASIKSPGQGWEIAGCTFEQAVDGSANFIDDSLGFAAGLSIHGNWMGDVSVPSSLVTLAGLGIDFRGNFMSAEVTGSTLVVVGTTARAVVIEANEMGDALVGISVPNLTNGPVRIGPNFYDVVTTPISAPNGFATGSQVIYPDGSQLPVNQIIAHAAAVALTANTPFVVPGADYTVDSSVGTWTPQASGFLIPSAGLYLVLVSMIPASSNTTMQAQVALNGAPTDPLLSSAGTTVGALAMGDLVKCVAGDHLAAYVRSGVSQNVEVTFRAVKVSD